MQTNSGLTLLAPPAVLCFHKNNPRNDAQKLWAHPPSASGGFLFKETTPQQNDTNKTHKHNTNRFAAHVHLSFLFHTSFTVSRHCILIA